MTEDLLHQLEEKVMRLLTEVEALRQENNRIKTERETHASKLQAMLSLLDSVSAPVGAVVNMGVGKESVGLLQRESI
jgi:hypothetical protein